MTSTSQAVVDTSAIVATISTDDPRAALADRIAAASELHAPHLIDVEFVSALQRLLRARQISAKRAAGALADFTDSPIRRYPHLLLLDRVWELRDSLSAYDATFVALSEALGVPLITTDAKLARAADRHTEIELF